MAEQQGTPNAIGGSSIEQSDVPRANGENVGGLIVGPAGQNTAYKKGGKVNLSNCKVSTHQKSKSSPNW
jgi:hypothetical protein